MKRPRLSAPAIVLGWLAVAGARAGAAEVELLLDAEVAYAGEPMVIQVRITDPESGMGAPAFEAVEGVRIRGPGRPSQQSSSSNVSGRMRQTTYVTYPYELTPLAGRHGPIKIGPFTVSRRGQSPLESNTAVLRVCRKPPVGIHFFEAQVAPPQGPVATPFRLTYTISYGGDTGEDEEGFGAFFGSRRNSSGLTGLDLPVLQQAGLKVEGIRVREDRNGSQVTLRTPGGEVPIVIQQGFAEREDGVGYRTLVFGFQVTPLVPGPVEVGGATATMQLLTGGTTTAPDVFGRPMRVAARSDFKATAPALAYVVRQLPAEGRPPGFAGAVGKYTVEAKTQKTEVRELDPIDVEVRIAGTGLLEDLRPPVWTEMPALTKDFEVSTDVDPGKVEGKEKVFRLTLRPRNDKVTQIPSIPFPYFEPRAFQYEVATAAPLPLKVQTWKTVTGADVVPSARQGSTGAPSASQPAAAAIVEQAGIGANFETPGEVRPALDPRQELLSPGFLGTMAAPPALLGLLALALRLRRRDPAAVRSARALSRATAALGSSASWDDLARSFGAYFQERLALPPGEVTPADVEAELARRGVPTALRDHTRTLQDRILAGRFGGQGETVASLGREAAAALEEVDACLR